MEAMTAGDAWAKGEAMRKDRSTLERMLFHHIEWVEGARHQWRRHRESYGDNFWRREYGEFGLSLDWKEMASISQIPLFAINRMRAWVVSYTASLFYRGFSADLEIDPMYHGVGSVGFKEGDKEEAVAPQSALVKVVLDRWFASEPFAVVTEQAFTGGLLYPHGALYLRDDPRPKQPWDRLTVEFMPPWECVWDRQAASEDAARYMGRMWWISHEQAEQEFGITPAECEKLACAKPDVLTDGLRGFAERQYADRSFVRVLDMYYPHAVQQVDAPSATSGSPASVTPVRGVRCVYLLHPNGEMCREVLRQAIKRQTQDGLPDVPIAPVVLTSIPEYPLFGLPNAATIYALELQANSYAAWLAQAFKLDALRKLFLDRSGLDDEGNENVMSDIDAGVVGTKPGALAGGSKSIAAWLDPPPSPATGVQLRAFVEQQFQAVSGTAPVTRGQPTPYIPATESANLTAYSETTLGMLRSKMDRAVASIAQKYLRALAQLLTAAGVKDVPVRHEGDIKPLPVEQIGLRWTLRITDGANTPAKSEAQKKDATQIAPLLNQLAASASSPQMPPAAQIASQRIWDELVKRFALDEKLLWKNIVEAMEDVPQGAQPPVAPPGGGEPGGATIPEQQPEVAPAVPGASMTLTQDQQAAADSDAAAEQELRSAFSASR